MEPIDPAIGKLVAQGWANYQVFAENQRAIELRNLSDDEAVRQMELIFDSAFPLQPRTTSGLIEQQRIFHLRK